ncbi:hypothetical protein M3Y99_01937800 [Aphelenchoides fujianensis]|nr:hypothetical protein M3Y99_01937800 [Aphelenchoides fujianensis]
MNAMRFLTVRFRQRPIVAVLSLFSLLTVCFVVHRIRKDEARRIFANFYPKERTVWYPEHLDPNAPRKAVFEPISARRTPKVRKEIAFVVMQYDHSKTEDYATAQRTLHCYAEAFGYPLIELNLADDDHFMPHCPGNDLMFVRHCVLARLMEERSSIDWFLFIDADMGVVNPNHLLEEFVDERADLIFYDRLYNYEIMAGSYIARNTEFSRTFLRDWAKYEERVHPDAVHGTDNGAISEVFLDHFCGGCAPRRRGRCLDIWTYSSGYDDLFLYESCARELLGPAEWFTTANGTLRQLASGRGYWARDGWQTESRFDSADFLFHGWKEHKRDPSFEGWEKWESPFASDVHDPAHCRRVESAHLNWAHDAAFRRPTDEIRGRLAEIARQSYAEHLQRLQDLNKRYPI